MGPVTTRTNRDLWHRRPFRYLSVDEEIQENRLSSVVAVAAAVAAATVVAVGRTTVTPTDTIIFLIWCKETSSWCNGNFNDNNDDNAQIKWTLSWQTKAKINFYTQYLKCINAQQ